MLKKTKYSLGALICLFFLYSKPSFSQGIAAKIVADFKTKLPIEYVYLNSEDKKLNLMTNQDGQVFINIDPKIKSYSLFKIGYFKKTISINDLIKSDTLFLTEALLNLQEVTVTSRTLDTIVSDKRFYVDDYAVLPNSDFMIITSRINVKGFEVDYYNIDKGISCRRKFVGENNPHFFSDCFKNIHLVTDDFSRQLYFKSDSTFDFMAKYTRTKFDSTVALCALKTDTQLVLKSFAKPVIKKMTYLDIKINSPYLTYTLASKRNTSNLYTVFYSKQLQEMSNNQVADAQSFKNAVNQGVADAIYSHKTSEQSVEAELSFFYTKIAKPIYAPIFLRNDTVVVFNFQEMLIVFLSKQGKMLKQVSLDGKDFSTFRDFEIVYDEALQRFYFRCKESDRSTLSLIDINTGKLVKKITLEKVFAKNIQILNNKIYYLVREKDWDDTCYLYRQNI